MTLCRVFTSAQNDNPTGYQSLFKRVFALVERITGKPVFFYPIHEKGIRAVVADMCMSQFDGMDLSGTQLVLFR